MPREVGSRGDGAGPRRPIGAAARSRRDERGSSLVLVLFFVVASSLIAAALANWAMNDLQNTVTFSSARALQSAASGATQVAIQSMRYTPLVSTSQTLNASPPSYCWGSSAPSELPVTNFLQAGQTSIGGSTEVGVWCSTAWNPSSATTRVVTFSTCLITTGMTASSCAADPALVAVVTFDDYPPGGSAPSAGQCDTYCGTSMTVDNWDWSPTVPVVSSVTPNAGSISGSTTVTITGTGLVSGSTVNFVEESGGTPASDNTVIPGTDVNWSSANGGTITAGSPAVTEGTTYFVTVTSPTGVTSAYQPTATFTYSGVVPTVSAVTANTSCPCSTYGGSEVTISGNGFVSGSTVNFIEESGGAAVSPLVSLAGAGVTLTTVNGQPALTAYSPNVYPYSASLTSGTTTSYFVTVTTPEPGGGTSAYGPVFTYTAP